MIFCVAQLPLSSNLKVTPRGREGSSCFKEGDRDVGSKAGLREDLRGGDSVCLTHQGLKEGITTHFTQKASSKLRQK